MMLLIFLPVILIFVVMGSASFMADDSGTVSEEEAGMLRGGIMAVMISVGVASIGSWVVQIWWMYTMYSELNAFRGKLYHPLLAACIPLFNIIAFYKYVGTVKYEYEVRQIPGAPGPLGYCCMLFILALGLPLMQSKMNNLWVTLGARPQV